LDNLINNNILEQKVLEELKTAQQIYKRSKKQSKAKAAHGANSIKLFN